MATKIIEREFNDIGEKVTIQLKYDDFEVTKLPKDCYNCPVGFMYRGCGREEILSSGYRPDTCKLKLVDIDKIFNNRFHYYEIYYAPSISSPFPIYVKSTINIADFEDRGEFLSEMIKELQDQKIYYFDFIPL